MKINNIDKFWQKLANGSHVLVLYKSGTPKLTKLPPMTARNRYGKKLHDLDNNKRVKALITSAQSVDSLERLKKKLKKSSMAQILDKYKTRFTKVKLGEDGELGQLDGRSIVLNKMYSM